MPQRTSKHRYKHAVLTSRVVPLREADSLAFLASDVFSRYVIEAFTVSSQPYLWWIRNKRS